MNWFRPQTYGFGARPANWKGWAVTLGYSALELALAGGMLLRPIRETGAIPTGTFIAWAVLSAVLTAGFVWLTWVKTDGVWRWRWGSRY